MLVVVATDLTEAASLTDELRSRGASTVTKRAVGSGRILLYGGPFDDGNAVDTAAQIRTLGWPTDVRPEGGGHLAAWRTHTAPTVIQQRLWVCFPWSEFNRDEADLIVEIDPGQAFGTGAHPTTHLLLEELTARIQGGESVLDVGCGSGVLAVAAATLGAAEVTAVDIAPAAQAATKANATRNGVGKGVLVLETPVANLTARYDAIVANIEASTLRDVAPSLQKRLAPGGWLALSGISPAQVSKVAAAYTDLTVTTTREKGDWSAVVATR